MYLQTDIFSETEDQDEQRYLRMLWNPTDRDGRRRLADIRLAIKALKFKPERDGTETKSWRNSWSLHYLSESEFWGGIEAVVRERTLSPEMRLELQSGRLCLCLLKDIFIPCNALLTSPMPRDMGAWICF